MFHQIHCLVSRGLVNSHVNDHKSDSNDKKVAIRTAFWTKNFDDDHLNHCFEYLRQSIMCTGDTTLEKVVVDENGVFKPDIDGWGTAHECKSWNMLYEFAESRRVKVIGDL